MAMVGRGPLTVLLVDDSQEFLHAASAWISTQSSMRLAGTARDGEQALAWLQRSEASLVLIDCFMPVLDGFETTRRIKSREEPPMVIMLSVHEGSAMEQEAWASGADGFLAKADLDRRLPELVRGMLATPRSPRRHRPVPHAPEGNPFAARGVSARPRADIVGS